MVPIRQFIDGFNKGDTKSAYSAYAAGDINIVDEFAPHSWTGPSAAHAWAAEYDKHAAATGVSEGSVKYSAPTRREVEGDLAYVIVPTVYLYKEHGKAMAEEGQMTFVLHTEGGGLEDPRLDMGGCKTSSSQVVSALIKHRMPLEGIIVKSPSAQTERAHQIASALH